MSHDNWQTPPALISALKIEFPFDLDAAADEGNAITSCYLTSGQDALKVEWRGKFVWCNPPYSSIGPFVEKAAKESALHNSTIVMLIPAYTDTEYWWEHCLNADEIRFLKGRLRFWEDGAPGKDTARFPSALIIFRPWWGMNLKGKGPHRISPRISWWNWKVSNEVTP